MVKSIRCFSFKMAYVISKYSFLSSRTSKNNESARCFQMRLNWFTQFVTNCILNEEYRMNWHHLAWLILKNFSEVAHWKWQPTTNRMVLRPRIFCKFIFLMFSSCICEWIYCFLGMRNSKLSILEVCKHFEWKTSNGMDGFWRAIIDDAFAIMNSSKRNGVFHLVLALALWNCVCIST